jgi:hypothetical protein
VRACSDDGGDYCGRCDTDDCFVRVAHGNEWTTRAKHVRKVGANAANVANLSSMQPFLHDEDVALLKDEDDKMTVDI